MAENLVIRNYQDAQSYRDYYNQVPVQEPDIPFMEQIVGSISGKRVFDVGCGCGNLAKLLISKGNTPMILDFSSVAIARAVDKAGSSAFPALPIMIEDMPPHTIPTTYIPEIVYGIDILGECFDIPKALKRMCWQTSGKLILTVGLLTDKIQENKNLVLWNETFMTHEDWSSLFTEHDLEMESYEFYETAICNRALYKLKWM